MPKATKAAQDFVPFEEIRDGTMILRDGAMRAVLMTSSVNFSLKSEDEQLALLRQFQNFLNTLEFSIQIFIQSRRLDIRPYIALLEDRLRQQLEDLLKIQTREYIEFIRNFTENSEIMTKVFFVIIPYQPPLIGAGAQSGVVAGLFKQKKEETREGHEKKVEAFEENQTQLTQRVSVVEQGLQRMGIRTVRLGTEELIEVFYKIFNPGELDKPMVLQQK
ncbi:MAG: hypothetical protein G01um101448_210 [Parcubacteria group bacterium Gr01-1014_48]|nr:MAG: hypothetical protein Greene041614_962 [Parcubacteria group bacterium Greene0416_14]TSC74334.1 MAG: hypothetical protein G01um101448_210 [Parcubacteria group bacterium Gr01-1014_48]TSD01035.1 MAG: hypothetical protein Greene101415_536 [Parcubacteria group bacterium Greene1014_15]TSD07727.1 MAG: hypothetical protein Greene07144_790 [Parcubacteria group bacterium Greene0714_4]